jgi:hypothetical protein
LLLGRVAALGDLAGLLELAGMAVVGCALYGRARRSEFAGWPLFVAVGVGVLLVLAGAVGFGARGAKVKHEMQAVAASAPAESAPEREAMNSRNQSAVNDAKNEAENARKEMEHWKSEREKELANRLRAENALSAAETSATLAESEVSMLKAQVAELKSQAVVAAKANQSTGTSASTFGGEGGGFSTAVADRVRTLSPDPDLTKTMQNVTDSLKAREIKDNAGLAPLTGVLNVPLAVKTSDGSDPYTDRSLPTLGKVAGGMLASSGKDFLAKRNGNAVELSSPSLKAKLTLCYVERKGVAPIDSGAALIESVEITDVLGNPKTLKGTDALAKLQFAAQR